MTIFNSKLFQSLPDGNISISFYIPFPLSTLHNHYTSMLGWNKPGCASSNSSQPFRTSPASNAASGRVMGKTHRWMLEMLLQNMLDFYGDMDLIYMLICLICDWFICDIPIDKHMCQQVYQAIERRLSMGRNGAETIYLDSKDNCLGEWMISGVEYMEQRCFCVAIQWFLFGVLRLNRNTAKDLCPWLIHLSLKNLGSPFQMIPTPLPCSILFHPLTMKGSVATVW